MFAWLEIDHHAIGHRTIDLLRPYLIMLESMFSNIKVVIWSEVMLVVILI